MLRNPETYAEKFQMTTLEGRVFLQNKTAVGLKEFLIKTCLPLQVDSTPAGQSAKRNLLSTLDSDEEQEETPPSNQKNARVNSRIVNYSAVEEENPPPPLITIKRAGYMLAIPVE